jgi:hypothetical protein
MKKPTKTKAVKAVKYWKSAGGSYLYPDKKAAQYFSGFQAPSVKPVALLPVDAVSVEAMIEQVKVALLENCGRGSENIDFARVALAAIGVKGGAK